MLELAGYILKKLVGMLQFRDKNYSATVCRQRED